MSKLRLIHDATKTQAKASAGVRPRELQLTDEEFSRRILTANHGPTCSAYLIRTFKRSIRKMGYFVSRIPAGEEMPMWYAIALRFLAEKSERWEVREIERPNARLWKVTYLRHGLFKHVRGTHLRVV